MCVLSAIQNYLLCNMIVKVAKKKSNLFKNYEESFILLVTYSMFFHPLSSKLFTFNLFVVFICSILDCFEIIIEHLMP